VSDLSELLAALREQTKTDEIFLDRDSETVLALVAVAEAAEDITYDEYGSTAELVAALDALKEVLSR
jgi:hypothetical protein